MISAVMELVPEIVNKMIRNNQGHEPYRTARCFSIFASRSSKPGYLAGVNNIATSSSVAVDVFSRGCSGALASAAFIVLFNGPSSFLAISYFICTSRSIVFISERAHDAHEDVSTSGEVEAIEARISSMLWRNSARLDALLRARLRAMNWEMVLFI